MIASKDEMLSTLGTSLTNAVVDRLRRLAHIPEWRLAELSRAALSETWGDGNYVLEKYLSVHVAWSIEQDRYTEGDSQIYVTAGHLQTRYGTPLYLVF